MKRYLAILLAALMVVTVLAGCGGTSEPSSSEAASGSTGGEASSEAAPETKVYNVVNLVNGNLGDKSFFDSCESGLAELQAAGMSPGVEQVLAELARLELEGVIVRERTGYAVADG